MLQLEKELVQARLSEAESQCALKEMQDKVLDIEKVRTTIPKLEEMCDRYLLSTYWAVKLDLVVCLFYTLETLYISY